AADGCRDRGAQRARARASVRRAGHPAEARAPAKGRGNRPCRRLMTMSVQAPHVALVLSKLNGVKPRGAGWRALCPAHPDHDPSLDIDVGDNGVILLYCRSRKCSVEAIVAGAGLQMSNLFPDGHRSNGYVPPPRRAPETEQRPLFESPDAYAKTLGN